MECKITNQGYIIKLETIPKLTLNKIIADLSVIPYKLDATKQEIEKSKFNVYYYSQDKKYIIIPRYYGVISFGNPSTENITFNPTKININFLHGLRSEQKKIMNCCLPYIKKHGGGLISVGCGGGKTIMAIYIACQLGLKTLVVVNKTFLLLQWIKQIREFSNAKIGVIQQNRCDVDNADIVIAMIHTISKRNYTDVFDKFGLVIYDEAHHIPCKFFSKALLKTSAKYTLALTATPYRGDRMIKIMYWFTGGVMYQQKTKINKNVLVKIINHKVKDPKQLKYFKRADKWFQGKIKPNPVKMTSNMCMIDSRNNAIVKIIEQLRKDPTRKILIL
jgi:superfamily II DNA or RNA helicase